VSSQDFSFNPPPFFDQAVKVSDLWTLTKGTRVATASLWNHPVRKGDLRCEVDGELQQSIADNDVLVLLDQASAWKAAFEAKGWTVVDGTRARLQDAIERGYQDAAAGKVTTLEGDDQIDGFFDRLNDKDETR
jgi:hypothetical protein